MGLHKLARELEETARQTAEMVDGITASLLTLGDTGIDCATARATAIRQIVVALQAQDRIEQRCRNMAEAARTLAQFQDEGDDQATQKVWSALTLDELRDESLSGVAGRTKSGEVEFF